MEKYNFRQIINFAEHEEYLYLYRQSTLTAAVTGVCECSFGANF